MIKKMDLFLFERMKFEMKKNLKITLLLILFLFPLKVNAKTYETKNLKEVLTLEGIEHDLGNYKESDEQIPIYMFRGDGCGYCKAFLTYLNTLVPDYGKYFKLVSYEVWDNEENASLMSEVATFLNKSADGVPYIIIGDNVFKGYATSYDEKIKNAIVDLYHTKKNKRYDVFKEMKKGNRFTFSNNALFLWITVLGGLIFCYQYRQFKWLNTRINEMNPLKENEKKKNQKEKKSKK